MQAYGLYQPQGINGGGGAGGADYGRVVMDTLVEQIQPGDGADRAVLMMGYNKKARIVPTGPAAGWCARR